jgi:hypothetical protein
MIYTVIWAVVAQAQLAERWMNATDRNAVTRAAHLIDQELRVDPDLKGFDFYGDRSLIVPPLQVVYRIRPDDRIVEVTMVF